MTAEKIVMHLLHASYEHIALSNNQLSQLSDDSCKKDYLLDVRTKDGTLSHKVSPAEALLYIRANVVDVRYNPGKSKIQYLRMRRDYASTIKIVLEVFYSGKGGFVGEDNRTFIRTPGKSYEHHNKHCSAFGPFTNN